MNVSKSPGPDNIHPRILKELSAVICKPLSLIFNNSILIGKLPDDWKCATVTAIYKKGDRKDSANYRPISLTCICCKILESILRDNVIDFMKENSLFSSKQFGFISGRSTVLQLIQAFDKWLEIFDNGGCVAI